MTPAIPKMVSEKIVSEELGIPLPTLRNQRSMGRGIPFFKIGKSVRYRIEDVLAYLEANRVDPGEVPRRGRPAAKGDAR